MDSLTHIESWTNLDGNEGFQTPVKPSYLHCHSASTRTVIVESPLAVSGLDTNATGANTRAGIVMPYPYTYYLDSTRNSTQGLAALESATATSSITTTSFTGVTTNNLVGTGSGAEFTVTGTGNGTTYTVTGVTVTNIGSGYKPGDRLEFTLTQATKTDATFVFAVGGELSTTLTKFVVSTSVDLADSITSVATTTVSGSGSGAVLTISGDTLLAVAGATPGLYIIDAVLVTTAGSGYRQGDRISFTLGDHTITMDLLPIHHLGQATWKLAPGTQTPFLVSRFKDNTSATDNGGQFTTYA